MNKNKCFGWIASISFAIYMLELISLFIFDFIPMRELYQNGQHFLALFLAVLPYCTWLIFWGLYNITKKG